jgi:hypothetical protein
MNATFIAMLIGIDELGRLLRILRGLKPMGAAD